MLAIILGILKFIGLLILGILGLLAVILLLVLLVPLRYRACGSYYGELKGTAGVSWLLHILSFQVKYDGEPDMCIRVFGIRLGGGETPAKDVSGREKAKSRRRRKNGVSRRQAGEQGPGESQGSAKAQEPGESQGPMEAQGSEKVSGAGEDQRPEKVSGAEETQGSGKSDENRDTKELRPGDHSAAGGDSTSAENKQKKPRKFTFGNPFEKIRVTFRRICGKLEALKDKKEQVMEFISQEDNKNTFRLLKRQVIALLKHILPGKVKGKVRFGFDDPYTTGQVLTWISPFYGLYAKKLQVIPVFDEKVLEGELELKGRIRIGTLIALALRMFLDKNFRKLLKKWREA